MPRINSLNPLSDAPDFKPSHWPPHLRYLTSPTYHSSVTSAARQHLQTAPPSASYAKGPKVAIRSISDPSHPANGQFGLFAAQRIPAKTRILYYIGEIHCDDREESNYDLSLCRLSDGTNVGVDATSMGNEARFVNDFRGIAKKPNAIFVDERTASGELTMSIWSSGEQIQKGQEILVSYGKSWWRSRAEEQG